MISCQSRGIIVNYDSKVWPCCYVSTQYKNSSYLKNLSPDWNNLKKHKIDDIMNHDAFKIHFNIIHWMNESKCDEVCTSECTVKKPKLVMKQHKKSYDWSIKK